MMQTRAGAFLLLASTAATLACEDTTGPGIAPLASVSVSPENDTIFVGDTTRLTAAAIDSKGEPVMNPRIAWSSSDTHVAVVDSAGLVTGLSPGSAAVAATLDNKSDSATITVLEVLLASIGVSPPGDTIVIGSTTRLTATLTGTNGQLMTGAPVVWSTLDPEIAGVDSTGLVTGVGVGWARITATASGITGRAVIAVVHAFAQLSAGGDHTCGITTSGAAYCWGDNAYGQLGHPSAALRQTWPFPVADALTFLSLNAGRFHTCGIALSGMAYCWGQNRYGELGNGSTTSAPTPTRVSGELALQVVTGGEYHTCGLTAERRAYCWGRGLEGQLGNGSADHTEPAPVSGGLSFTGLAAAFFRHTCGIASGGPAYCWGENSRGQLGNGSTTGETKPVPVFGDLDFRTIDGGWFHTCALTPTGDAYCWGDNRFGQLGDGSNVGSTTAVRVDASGITFTAISVGSDHACALTAAGKAYCWGNNWFGQLGDGTAENRPTPVAVAGDLTFRRIAAGGWHTCAVTGEGAAYCWGFNLYGQLGTGSRANTSVPAVVIGALYGR